MSESAVKSTSATSATEWAAFLRRAGERQARFLRQLIPLFLIECPELMSVIRQAIAEKDATQLKFAAHTLKSSMLFLAIEAATEPLQQLEAMGRKGNLSGAEEAQRALEAVLATLLPVLADFAIESP